MIRENESEPVENEDQRLPEDSHYLSNYTYTTSQQPPQAHENTGMMRPEVTFQELDSPQLKLKTQQIILETIHGVIM